MALQLEKIEARIRELADMPNTSVTGIARELNADRSTLNKFMTAKKINIDRPGAYAELAAKKRKAAEVTDIDREAMLVFRELCVVNKLVVLANI